MKVEVLTGPQGGGKSTVMRNEALDTEGLYLFALPTIELIEEQSAAFFADKPLLRTEKVHKDSGHGSVARRLTDARSQFEKKGVSHGVIFTTHETMMNHALEGFDRWNIRIDEAPAAIQAGRFNISVSRPFFEQAFEIVGVKGSEWSSLHLKIEKPNWKDVLGDKGATAFSEFIKQASQPSRVFVRAASWDKTNDIEWFSMWTPLSLSNCKSVQIAGSSYTSSVGYRACGELFDDLLVFSEREIAPHRTQQPSITIHYFTEGHEGSTTFWGTSEGRACIKAVCDHLGENLTPDCFWSGNEVVQHLMEHRLPGTLIKPMAMGLNKHRLARDCAFIFSSKATPDDEALRTVLKMTDDDIRHAREDDAVAQFVMRGAIRDLNYGSPYSIYLYSRTQADRLSEHLAGIGFTSVETAPLDAAGLMDKERRSRVRTQETAEERDARIKRRAQNAKARAQRNRDDKKEKAANSADS